MTSSTTPAIRPLPFKASINHATTANTLPTSVRGAPPELRRLIRKRQNSESAKRCRLRRKLEAQKDVGTTQLTSNQQLEQLQQLVNDLANRLFQTQDIVAALVAHAQHNVQTQSLQKPVRPQYQMPQIPQMQAPCKQESIIAPSQIISPQQQPQRMIHVQPMQQVIQQQPPVSVPMTMAAPVPVPVPVVAQEQKQHVVQPPTPALQPPALADLSDLQYQPQQPMPASPACSSSTISTIENHPDIMAPAPNAQQTTPTEEVGSPFSELNDIGTDFVYSVDLRDLGNEAYNL